jgi:tetratricopeptide (TPR) repeat protein
MALSFDALLADVYWIRTVQHYGSTKRVAGQGKSYELLGPLLDITTTLDPYFDVAYRFGAIFLAEAFPNGPGRPDLAIALLRKGIAAMPERWQYYMDIGFIYYWWLGDYEEAAGWFGQAADVPGASWWLRPLAANTLTIGGSRESSRLLWKQMYDSADSEWIRNEAIRRLTQLQALDDIDQLRGVIQRFHLANGRFPGSWSDLVEAGYLAEAPEDPTGHAYVLDVANGVLDVSSGSELFPLPGESFIPLFP